jgi:parallel beta-helix repeat protein
MRIVSLVQVLKFLSGIVWIFIGTTQADENKQIVNSTQQLISSIERALPGTHILLAPGVYPIHRVDTKYDGTEKEPIIVAPLVAGTAIIEAQGREAISVHHSHWIFQDLIIRGGKNTDHAFHISGNADHVVLRRNTLVNFHSHVKVNGVDQHYPDFGLIEDNDIFNESVRETSESVTPLDIVGGRGWHVLANYIADFGKTESDKTSYGLFLKGNSNDGRIERNLVICSRLTDGGTRIGISLGGGGTGREYCTNGDCSYEHSDGVIRNNIVINCSDVGIYINKARNSLIEHNTLFLTLGIDIRFPQSSAEVRSNIVSGSIRARDGSNVNSYDNQTFGTSLGMLFPKVNAYLKNRISDYDKKFPNWIDQERVSLGQSAIDHLFSPLINSRLGLGITQVEEDFPGILIGDLTPERNVIDKLVGKPVVNTKEDNLDFWGNRRTSDKSVIGAIDFFVSPCDIRHRIERKPINGLTACVK